MQSMQSMQSRTGRPPTDEQVAGSAVVIESYSRAGCVELHDLADAGFKAALPDVSSCNKI